MSDVTRSTAPPKALIRAVRRILRPLVRGFIHFGLTWPLLADLVKRAYVETAREELRAGAAKKPSDSRISLMTRVHRKDIRRFRLTEPPPALDLASLSVVSQIIARWQADPHYRDAQGRARPLPRSGAGSFDELAARVSKDMHPRAILDELVRIKAVSMTGDNQARLDIAAFVPHADFDNLAWYFGLNLHDHIAASTHNISGKTPPFLDRSVHYSGLSASSVAILEKLSRDLGMKALLAVNARAQELEAQDKASPQADQRMTFGIYFYGENDARDD